MNDETTNEASQEVGTTERLFGREEAEASIETTPEPVAESAPEPSREAKPRDESGKFVAQKAETTPSPDSEYLPIEALGDKKVKVKIGGEEKEILVRDLVRGYQTDQYLTQKGQKLAEEYRQSQAFKTSPVEAPTASTQDALPDDDFTREYIKPYVEVQNKTIETLKQELEQLRGLTAPLEYNNNVKIVANIAKEQGYQDFEKYLPDIEHRILNLPVEVQERYDSQWGYLSIYKDIKIAELQEAMAKGKAPASLPDQRPKPKVANVEPGGGTPTGNDDRTSHLTALKDRAIKSGRTHDWAAYVQEKLGG